MADIDLLKNSYHQPDETTLACVFLIVVIVKPLLWLLSQV